MRIAVYPGTFDPITKGHEDIVLRSLPLFDKIIVSIGHNAKKTHYYTLNHRISLLKTVFDGIPKVEVMHYEGLTTDFCREVGARFILRGMRSSTDFEFERNIAQANSALAPEIESVFFVSSPGLSAINSSIVREILKFGGDVSQFMPEKITKEDLANGFC